MITNSSESWSCGVFIAGLPNEIPLAKFYEIPAQKASCPAKFRDTWRKGKFSKKCGKMGREWENKWMQGENWEDLWSPFVKTLSRGEFERNVCTLAKEELGIENVPGLELSEPLKVITFLQTIISYPFDILNLDNMISFLAWLLL